MTHDEARIVIVDLVGQHNPATPELRTRLLGVLTRRQEWAPQEWSMAEERGYEPFDIAEATAIDHGGSEQMILFRREDAPRYQMMLFMGRQPRVFLRTSSDSLGTEPLEHLFAIADGLAEAFEPDLGWAHILSDEDEPADRARAQLDDGVGAGPDVDDTGPRGLGLRTYLGPRAVARIGADRLRTLPAPASVRWTTWGGAIVDLVPEPWHADERAILASYQACNLDTAGAQGAPPPASSSPPPAPRATIAPPAPPSIEAAELIAAAQAGRKLEDRSFAGVVAPGANLSRLQADRVVMDGGDFTRASFAGAGMSDCDIERGVLAEAVFDDSHLFQVGYRDSDLTGVAFNDAEVVACFFAGATLRGAVFTGARLELSNFDAAVAGGARFISSACQHLSFDGAELTGASFTGARLEECSFEGAELRDADFSGAVLRNCRFTGAHLDGARWAGARGAGNAFDSGAVPPVKPET